MISVTQRLSISQRRELLEAVQASAFDAAEFDWEEHFGEFASLEDLVPALVHRPSGFYVAFAQKREPKRRPDTYGDFIIQEVPGSDSALSVATGLDWDLVMIQVRDWLHRARLEHEGIDPWELLKTGSRLVPATTLTGTFSAEEVRRIEEGFSEVISEVRNAGLLTAGQLAGLEQVVNDLSESAGRLSRKDWANILVGALVGWMFSNAVPTATGQIIVTQIASAIHSILNLPLLLK